MAKLSIFIKVAVSTCNCYIFWSIYLRYLKTSVYLEDVTIMLSEASCYKSYNCYGLCINRAAVCLGLTFWLFTFFFYSNNLGRPFQKKKSDFKKSFLYQNIHIHIWQGLLCKAVLPLWFLRRTWNLEVRTDPLLPVAEAVSCWNMIIAHEEQNHCWSLTPVLSSVNVVKPLRSKRWPANIPKSTQTYSSHTQMN